MQDKLKISIIRIRTLSKDKKSIQSLLIELKMFLVLGVLKRFTLSELSADTKLYKKCKDCSHLKLTFEISVPICLIGITIQLKHIK